MPRELTQNRIQKIWIPTKDDKPAPRRGKSLFKYSYSFLIVSLQNDSRSINTYYVCLSLSVPKMYILVWRFVSSFTSYGYENVAFGLSV